MTMTCSMLALVKDSHILEGNILTRVSIKLAEVALSQVAPSVSSRVGNQPAPLKMLAITRPITQATAVVHRKKATVFQPMEPTFFMSPMDKMPSIMDSSTTGTTMNFSRLTKIVPKGLR